jgi:acetyl-CoA synthetase
MLACARIGAIHSVVFGGFSSESLRDRINDAECTVLITADGGWRRGQVVPLKKMADEALTGTPSIRTS